MGKSRNVCIERLRQVEGVIIGRKSEDYVSVCRNHKMRSFSLSTHELQVSSFHATVGILPPPSHALKRKREDVKWCGVLSWPREC